MREKVTALTEIDTFKTLPDHQHYTPCDFMS